MLVYHLRRVLLNILNRSLYAQLQSTLFRQLNCPYAWEVSQVSNSYTVILFRELKCVGGINVGKTLSSCIFLLI